ncbi:MAG: RDD family protein [Candidatus Hodarchaeota archaeon]
MNELDSYVKEVGSWIPTTERKKRILNVLRGEVTEAMTESGLSPEEAYGKPYDTAKNLCKGQEWVSKPANYRIRAKAYLIDMLIIVGAVLISWLWWFPSIYLPSTRGEISEGYMLMILILFLIPYSFLWMLGYPTILEKVFSTTLGKRLYGLYVYDESGVRLTWSQAFRRNVTKTQPIILMNELENNPRFQHGRDLQVKTVVVIRKRISKT